jgi:hypothetical protein
MGKRAIPTPMDRARLEQLREKPSDAITLARITAGEMAWLLDLALAATKEKADA